jgi:hypothetical protein
MRLPITSLFVGVIVCCLLFPLVQASAQRTSLVPSASPLPTPTATPQVRPDTRKESKRVHEFFKAFGWLRNNEHIPDDKIPAAVRRIQKVLRVPPTGVYDDRVDSVLSRPRCGTIPPYNATDAIGDGDIRKRFVLWGPKWDHSPITYRFLNYTAKLPSDRQKSIFRSVT